MVTPRLDRARLHRWWSPGPRPARVGPVRSAGRAGPGKRDGATAGTRVRRWHHRMEDPGGLLGGLEHALDLEVQVHLVADHGAVGAGDDAVEADAEVLAADLALGREAGAVAAVSVRAEAVDLEGQRDRAGDVADGQVAVDVVLAPVQADAGGLEGDVRGLLDVQEVLAADVVVTVALAGVDRRGVDGGVHARRELGRAGDEGALDLLELAADLAHHHVTDAEADLGVDRVDRPGAGYVTGDLSSSGAHGLSHQSLGKW